MRPTTTGPTFDDTFDAILPVAGSVAALAPSCKSGGVSIVGGKERAASLALPFERPKLGVVVNVNHFADSMEEIARKRYSRGNVIDASPNPELSAPAPNPRNVEVVKEID